MDGGLYGSSNGAALVSDVWYQRSEARHWRRRRRGGRTPNAGTEARLTGFESDSWYRTGGWERGHPGPRFRYGGPGSCG